MFTPYILVFFIGRYGIYEKDRKVITKHYMKEGTFKRDIASLAPLEIFYFATGFTGRAVLFRNAMEIVAAANCNSNVIIRESSID
jgi:hypothetical protein